MKSQVLGIITIILSAIITVITEPVSENLNYQCLQSSVKLDFKRKSPLHEVTLSTDLFKVKECNKKFMTYELTIMEIDFDKRTLGARNFFININEYNPEEADPLLYSLPIYCESKPDDYF